MVKSVQMIEVGDRVVRWQVKDDSTAMRGTVLEATEGKKSHWVYKVKWDSGAVASYTEGDLRAVEFAGLEEKDVRREWEDADLAWESAGTQFKVLVLGEHDYAPLKNSTHYDHTEHGPALMVITITQMGTRVDIHDVNHKPTWQWISRMIGDGIKAYDPKAKLTSAIDMAEKEHNEMLRKLQPCAYCHGSGTLVCPECGGEGKINGETCGICEGKGESTCTYCKTKA